MRKLAWISLVAALSLNSLHAPAGAIEVQPAAVLGPVLVNGNPVPKAKTEVNIEKEVIEFREGGTGDTRLIPGRVKYRVCIESPGLVPAIEAACAPDAQNPYLEVGIEDGRAFSRCLVESSKTFNRRADHGSKRITGYCLRCEGPS